MQPQMYLKIFPFLYYSYGPGWVQLDMLTALDEELAEAAPYWTSALTGRDLQNWVRLNAHLNKISAELYNPNYFA